MKIFLILFFMPVFALCEVESIYLNNLNFRQDRKVGVGFGVGGVHGLYGMDFELNLEQENAFLTGFGQGPGFNTFHALWKHSYEGQYITPYYSAGLSYWYNSQIRNVARVSHVLDSVLSDSVLNQGQFGIGFVTGSVGMQYNQLDGEWIGSSFYFEFNLLGALNNRALVPTASLGVFYYF